MSKVHIIQNWYDEEVFDRLLHCFVRFVLEVLDVQVKRGLELSTDLHFVVFSLGISKPLPKKKSRWTSEAFRIK